MNEKNLIERATVEFPRPIDIDEMHALLEYVSHRMPARINYSTTHHTVLMPDSPADPGSFSIGGMIRKEEEAMAFDQFETVCSSTDYQKAIGLRFNIVPGWEESDYRPEVAKLRDDTRELIGLYFKCRKGKK